MKIFETYKDIPQDAQNAVVVIGNFDGVHRGHQVLLARAKESAADKNTKVAVLTFEPHPRCLFRPDDPPFRLTMPDLKAQKLKDFGVDILFSLPFDWDFASQSAEDFVQNILIDGLKPAHVIVGYDFKFGQLRKGDANTIRDAGLSIDVIEEVSEEGSEEGGGDISSSTIRQALRHGKPEMAHKLLGWDWEIRGVVQKGDQRGRDFGYPTANFPLEDIVHPRYGVYAARVQIEGEDEWRMAAVNIGIRPMFALDVAQVEAFLLDFDGDLYGKALRMRLVAFLRGEAKFNSVDDLIVQMDKDCKQARDILSS